MTLRRLKLILLLYAGFDLLIGGYNGGFLPLSLVAAAQTTITLASGGIANSCNAVTASTSANPGTAAGCASVALLTSGSALPVVYTWQVTTTGSPASTSVNFVGSLDGVTWTQLDTTTGTTARTVTGNAYRFLGCIPTTLSGGSSPTLTCQLSVSSGTAGGLGNVASGTVNGIAVYTGATTVGSTNPPTTNCVYNVIFNVTGSAAVAPTAACPGITPNAQTGTSYTYLFSDRGGFTTFCNASAIATALPQVGTAGFANNWYNLSQNGASSGTCTGTLTITPTTSKISYTGNGASCPGGSLANSVCQLATSLVIAPGTLFSIKTDADGTDYFANVFSAATTAGPTFASPHTYWVPIYGYVTSPAQGATAVNGANQPDLYAFNLTTPATVGVINVYIVTGNASATCDAGFYGPIVSGSTTGSLVAHTGSFACATSSSVVSTSLTPVTLQPGMYYLAVCSSNGADTFGATASSVTGGAFFGSSAVMGTDKLYGWDITGADNCTAGVLPASFTIANIVGNGSAAPILLVTN